jgi:hypothetical protein
MKTQFYLFFILTFVLASHARNDNTATNQWGTITNGIQMSIALDGGDRIIETNEQFRLSVQIKNLGSLGAWSYLLGRPTSNPSDGLHCIVISPSGKDVSPNVKFAPGIGSGRFVSLPPNGADRFNFNLSSICKFDEVGTYRITAEKTISQGEKWWTVVSNPLLVRACETNAENWGVISNGVRIAITLEGGDREVERGGEVKLLVRMIDRDPLGANAYFRLAANSDPREGLHCVVLSPSGKDVSPNVTFDRPGRGKMIGSSIGEPASFEFDLSSICKFDEVGTYRITGEKAVFQGAKQWTVVSRPLFVKVLPAK